MSSTSPEHAYVVEEGVRCGRQLLPRVYDTVDAAMRAYPGEWEPFVLGEGQPRMWFTPRRRIIELTRAS